jgi:carbonic anhydrase
VPPYRSDGSGEAASIEYAVAVLKVAHIIVCGHSDCGAMTAVSAPHTVETLPAIKAWLRHAEPAKLANAARTHPSAQAELQALIEENVIAQLTHLATHPSVAEAMSEGKLTVHGWTYDIGTGRVLTLDSATRRFIELADATEAPAAATWAHRHPMPTPN